MRNQLIALTLVFALGGCVEPFDGSVVQMTLTNFRSPCEMIGPVGLTLPAGWQPCTGNPGEDRLRFHFEIWATIDRTALFRLQSFNVQTAVLLDEQIEYERQGVLLSNGRPFGIQERPYDSLTAQEQAALRDEVDAVNNVYAITSFTGERLQADGKTLAPDLYVGNYLNLQRPRNGQYFGQVNGAPPGGGALVVGGATLRTPISIDDADSIVITIEQGALDRKPLSPSDLTVVSGTPRESPRGVLNVEARGNGVAASFGFYHGLDEREFF